MNKEGAYSSQNKERENLDRNLRENSHAQGTGCQQLLNENLDQERKFIHTISTLWPTTRQ